MKKDYTEAISLIQELIRLNGMKRVIGAANNLILKSDHETRPVVELNKKDVCSILDYIDKEIIAANGKLIELGWWFDIIQDGNIVLIPIKD